MIKNMLGDKELGLYSVAKTLTEVWYFIPMIIIQSVFPAIVNAKKLSEEIYYRRLRQLYTLMAWIAIAIALPISILSGFIINILFGQLYMESAKVLAIHIWADVFVFLGMARGQWITAENLQKYAFYFTLLTVIMNILLNGIFIPLVGITGAAWATLVSQACTAIVFPAFFSPTRKSSIMLIESLILKDQLFRFLRKEKQK
jgi:O-antigen/teichoic acid export membrane protein